METKIKKIISSLLKRDDIELKEKLLGGRSNINYTFILEGKKYVFRIPGKGAENFVDRNIEKNNLDKISYIGITPKPIYFDVKSGYKITPYVEGLPLDELENKDYEEISSVLKKIHNMEKFDNDYNQLERLKKYEKIHNNKTKRYEELKSDWIEIYYDILEKVEKVPCHGDSQTSNFVKGDKLYLLDWEFSGNTDPIYDIACFGNEEFLEAEKLMSTYYRNPTEEQIKRLYSWRLYQCLQWYNVASYKDEIGLSADLEIDFKKATKAYLEKGEYFHSKI